MAPWHSNDQHYEPTVSTSMAPQHSQPLHHFPFHIIKTYIVEAKVLNKPQLQQSVTYYSNICSFSLLACQWRRVAQNTSEFSQHLTNGTVMWYWSQHKGTACTYSTCSQAITLGWVFRNICKTIKSHISFMTSICMEQVSSHWTNFHKIWYLRIFEKSFIQIQVQLKTDKNNAYFTYRTA